MFVPRAVRLKGVKEVQRPKVAKPPAHQQTSKVETNSKDALVQAMGETSMNSPAPQQDTPSDATAPTRGPRFASRPITTEYLAQLVAGIELIFTDYAHQEEERSKWMRDRYREVDGEQNYIHLTAILAHPNVSSLKPEATQILLKQALHDQPSELLELSRNEYYVRRRPSTIPLPFVPSNSFSIVDDDGLTFWDQRTIYVEAHLRSICPSPAKVAQWLAFHGGLKPKWLPVQAVHTLWNNCAFVVLSGNVMHEDTWNKWRETQQPENWKIMTKVEHTRRTAEYLALMEKENPRGMPRNPPDMSRLPPIARPAALPVAFEALPEALPQAKTVDTESGGGKKKRKRRKPPRSTGDDAVANAGDNDDIADLTSDQRVRSHEQDTAMVDAPQDAQPDPSSQQANKKKRKRRKSGKPNNAATDDVATADIIITSPDAQSSKKPRH